ncbi:MAG: UvrD-helicase domain-containing protein [Magnetococcales bacterium]|nr:UvrD-helicase domain-containing protein [Magnetococcales bacterium]
MDPNALFDAPFAAPDAATLSETLNPPQLEAVTTLDGPLMVLAGAGSGKTRVLTHRLAHIITSGVAMPEEILAVTFTNKAAREMHTRVLDLIGPGQLSDPRRLWVGTFHSMGARVLRRHADRLGYGSDFTILDSSDQERLVKQITEAAVFNHDYWKPKRLVGAFSRWKDDGLGPGDLTEQHIRFRNERERIADLYAAYQDELKRANSMDFGDLLLNCLLLWNQNPEILDDYRKRFRHILVDEYQDTNAIQHQWLKWLSSHHGNLCVVGDDDQSIYGWRGARLDNILDFEQEYPGTRIIRLEQNYRSTGHILNAAGGLIQQNAGRMDKTLWTEGDKGHELELYAASDGDDEAQFVASEIERQAQGTYQRIAVLVRASWQTRTLEEAFQSRRIPYVVVGGMRFLDRLEVKDAVAYLRLAYSNRDDMAFTRIYNTPKRRLGPAVLDTLHGRAIQDDCSLFEASRRVLADGSLRKQAHNQLEKFIYCIDEGNAMLKSMPPHEALNQMLESSGYLHAMEKEEKRADKMENLEELANQISRYDDTGRFLEEATLVTDMGNKQDPHATANHVVISTLHGAKGLEFPVVFMVGMEEGMLPHKMAIADGEEGVEEERRLTYVGLTRAKERLFLSYAQKRWVFREMQRSKPSRFLKEIPKESIKKNRSQVSVRRGVSRRRIYY